MMWICMGVEGVEDIGIVRHAVDEKQAFQVDR